MAGGAQFTVLEGEGSEHLGNPDQAGLALAVGETSGLQAGPGGGRRQGRPAQALPGPGPSSSPPAHALLLWAGGLGDRSI